MRLNKDALIICAFISLTSPFALARSEGVLKCIGAFLGIGADTLTSLNLEYSPKIIDYSLRFVPGRGLTTPLKRSTNIGLTTYIKNTKGRVLSGLIVGENENSVTVLREVPEHNTADGERSSNELFTLNLLSIPTQAILVSEPYVSEVVRQKEINLWQLKNNLKSQSNSDNTALESEITKLSNEIKLDYLQSELQKALAVIPRLAKEADNLAQNFDDDHYIHPYIRNHPSNRWGDMSESSAAYARLRSHEQYAKILKKQIDTLLIPSPTAK